MPPPRVRQHASLRCRGNPPHPLHPFSYPLRLCRKCRPCRLVHLSSRRLYTYTIVGTDVKASYPILTTAYAASDYRPAGTSNVPSTTCTKLRSSRKMQRFCCANLKFSCASGSVLSRSLYRSYDARLSNAIGPQATTLVPSYGRKYPIRCPPQRGITLPQFAAYCANASF